MSISEVGSPPSCGLDLRASLGSHLADDPFELHGWQAVGCAVLPAGVVEVRDPVASTGPQSRAKRCGRMYSNLTLERKLSAAVRPLRPPRSRATSAGRLPRLRHDPHRPRADLLRLPVPPHVHRLPRRSRLHATAGDVTPRRRAVSGDDLVLSNKAQVPAPQPAAGSSSRPTRLPAG